MNKYKTVYFNELDQRIWRTDTSAGKISILYGEAGSMTAAEYDLLTEVLWELFDDKKITLKEFIKIFDEIRTFCDKVKDMVE